jgi:hypothetical protein
MNATRPPRELDHDCETCCLLLLSSGFLSARANGRGRGGGGRTSTGRLETSSPLLLHYRRHVPNLICMRRVKMRVMSRSRIYPLKGEVSEHEREWSEEREGGD